MNMTVSSSAMPRNEELPSTEDLTLDQARAIVGSMTLFSDRQIIAACTVIEKEGRASEKLDFRALRQVLERKYD